MEIGLDSLKIGQKAKVNRISGNRKSIQRLLEMGLTPGTMVHLLKFAPLGDPIEILLLAFRLLNWFLYFY